jgi:hypothetical protein
VEPNQYVGMARYDLYLRQDDPSGAGVLAVSDRGRFAMNFFKGAFGLWLQVCLVIGLAVCFSTNLGGIISFLCVMFLFLGGLFREFIGTLVAGDQPGTGPAEAFLRLVNRENLVAPLQQTAATRVAVYSDEGFRFLFRMIQYILPDIDRLDFTTKVAEGFNVFVFAQDMLPALLLLVGYLLPWAVLAYYMFRSREIAGAT